MFIVAAEAMEAKYRLVLVASSVGGGSDFSCNTSRVHGNCAGVVKSKKVVVTTMKLWRLRLLYRRLCSDIIKF